MRVLHINANYLFTNLHQCMVRALTAQGVDNQVFAPMHAQSNPVVNPDENVTVSVCYKKWDRLFFKKKQQRIRNALEANVNVSDFDLLHAYMLFTDGDCAYELSKKYNIPYVVAVRNTDVNIFFKWMPHLRKRGVKILTNAKAVFFLSETYKELVINNYVPGILQEALKAKSYVIPNGIDDFWHKNRQTEERRECHDPVRLIFAGRIHAHKNIPITQAAMKVLQDRGYDSHLTVVGKVADKAVFNQIIRDENTTYIPPKDKSELIHIYRDNDIFVMPSRTESFGLVYAEAMSQGLPVIYTKGQGFDGQFPEGEVGYSVNPCSPEDIANKIIQVIQDYELLNINCREKHKKFNWDSIVEKYVNIYSEIVQN